MGRASKINPKINIIVNIDDKQMDMAQFSHYLGCSYFALYNFIRRRRNAGLNDPDIVAALLKKYNKQGTVLKANESSNEQQLLVCRHYGPTGVFRVAVDGVSMLCSEFAKLLGVDTRKVRYLWEEGKTKGIAPQVILENILTKFGKPTSFAVLDLDDLDIDDTSKAELRVVESSEEQEGGDMPMFRNTNNLPIDKLWNLANIILHVIRSGNGVTNFDIDNLMRHFEEANLALQEVKRLPELKEVG